MNKTDVIKIGPAASPPSLSAAILLWGEKKHKEGKWCCSSLTLSPPLSFALRLSFCFSSFCPSPPLFTWSPGLQGLTEHRGWAVQTPRQCKGEEQEAETSEETEGRLHVCVSLCEFVCVFVGQVQLSHFSLLGNMKPDKQRNYAASYSGESYTGRDKNRGYSHRGADQKWKQDWGEPQGQGVDCWGVWICMTGQCERMEVWVDGSCVCSKSAGLLHCVALYRADVFSNPLYFQGLMYFNWENQNFKESP